MHARTADSKTHSQRTLPQFKNRRVAEREPMLCRVTYTYQVGSSTYAVDGVTRDLCRIGCGIRGTIIIPRVGSKTRLKVYLPGQKLPISSDARVTWVAGDYFGVQFQLESKDYTRVRQYMWSVLNRVA
jgi:hypothetical protein